MAICASPLANPCACRVRSRPVNRGAKRELGSGMMNMRQTIAASAALALAILFAPLGGPASPALAQPADAAAAYNNALAQFKSVLAERRRQIDAKQPLPNLPGQQLYLARNLVMSTYKD